MRQIFLAAVLANSLAASAAADALPRWEVGLGIGALGIPDYRGADQRHDYVLPLPYVQYRGEVFRIDREGAHGRLFVSDRMKLEVSLAAGPPAKSGQNEARAGMPDLDPTVEAGPSLQISLARNATRDRLWSLQLPLRAAAAVNLHQLRRIGWIFAPNLSYEASNVRGGWDLGIAAGPLYASARYHEYYYEVAPAFATPARPAYDARGGYSGSRLTLTASRRFPQYWVGAFARYDNLSGAVFADSPLVKRKDSFMAGVGIARILAQARYR
jgi:outer membrane protein